MTKFDPSQNQNP